MADLVEIQFETTGEQKTAQGIRRVSSETGKLGKDSEQAARRADRAFQDFGNRTDRTLRTVRNALVALGLAQFVRQTISVVESTERMERAFKFATGGAEAGRREFAFLREESQRLGIDLETAGAQFAKLSAASRGTALQGEDTREIFSAVAEAATVLGLSAEQTGGALTAVEQIISKGKVATEELRGQLGERLPGAFQIAARAMGVTTERFAELLQAGLRAEDFLPKFAAELRKSFGPEVADAARGLTAEINRFKTSVFEFLDRVGRAGVTDTLVDSLGRLRDIMRDPTTASRIDEVVSRLSALAKFAAENAKNIIAVGAGIAAATGHFVVAAALLGGIVVAARQAAPGVEALTVQLARLTGLDEAVIAQTSSIEEFKEKLKELGREGETGLLVLAERLIEIRKLTAANFIDTEDQDFGKGLREAAAAADEVAKKEAVLSKNARDFTAKLREQVKALEGQRLAITEGADATIAYEAALLRQEAATLKASGAAEPLIKKISELREEIEAAAELDEVFEEAAKRIAKLRDDIKEGEKLGSEFDEKRLTLLGRPEEARRLAVERRLKAELAGIEKLTVAEEEKEELATKARGNAQLELETLTSSAFDLSSSVQDIFLSAIDGTLSAADIGKRILSDLARFAADQVSGVLTAVLQGGQQGPSSSPLLGLAGGLVSAVLGGSSPASAGTTPNTNTTGGGGGGGFGGIGGTVLSLAGTVLSSALGSGTTGGITLAGLATSASSAISGLASSVVSIVGSIPIAGWIAAAVATAVITGLDTANKQLTGGGFGIIGSILQLGNAGNSVVRSVGAQPRNTAQAGLQNVLSNFVAPGLGIAVGALANALNIFGPRPDPRIKLGSELGLGINPETGLLKFDSPEVDLIKKFDVSGNRVNKTIEAVELILDKTGDAFEAILNVFPRFVTKQVIPAIEESELILNQILGTIQFSDQGPDTITDELKRLSNKRAQQFFFLGTRGVLGEAAATSFTGAGLSPELADLARSQFPGLPEGTDLTGLKAKDIAAFGGLRVPNRRKNIPGFLDALQSFANFSGSLARGGSFLTDLDTQALNDVIRPTLEADNAKNFGAEVELLLEKANPVLDFIRASIEQSQNLFASGLTAAIEAANESQAKVAFLESFGQGIRASVLGGLQEAFIASAQFNELLAPIQQKLRDIVQQSLATGEPPDIDAFRTAILPTIEDASARAVALAPLAAELNRLNTVLNDTINAGGLGSTAAPVPSNVNITIQGGNGTPQQIAAAIADLLGGQLAPPDLA